MRTGLGILGAQRHPLFDVVAWPGMDHAVVCWGGVVMTSLSPILCRSVLDERCIWIAFGTSGWSKALGRKALSTGRLAPILVLGACVVSGSGLGGALRCGGVRVWVVSLLWCPPIPLAVSSARKICCRSRALCTPARMSSRIHVRLRLSRL